MGAIMDNSDASTPLINSDSDTKTIKSSGFRWMVLLGLSSQNIFSGILWISLAPIANHAISYYNMTAYSLNAINLIFPLTTVLLGLATAALINIFGVRLVLGTGILCNLTCAFIRLCSTWLTQSFSRFVLLVVAQVIASIAQPFCLFAPTKLALVWFPDTQRTTATTIASLANSLGVLIGSAYPPLLVKQPNIEHRRRLEHGSRYVGFQLTCFLKISLIVGKTGSILYGIKVCFALAALGAIGFSVTVYFPDCAVLIGFFVACFGGFGFSIYGLSLEMAAEATYPVPEMVTTGLLLILSQLLSIILIMIMQIFAPVIRDSPLQTCGPDVLVKASHFKLQMQ
ncbi:unnamed protein product [Dibothriocephalus latus]|uniref:Major facilitator superfamily (MFS) profile domain-containing protein n=1 Tax=Dibothriocephalus latus TaxID=60516 RepID=A0A3P7L3U3_DIBLA|nr:unnamed protein product [Dibothriocephalus latus]